MTGPQDPARGDQFRAGHADRERVIETLKDAFVHGRLTKDELDTRAGQALTARTYADLAALTADIPPGLPAARLPHTPAQARRWPLAKAAAGSGGCLAIAFAAMRVGQLADPGNTPGTLPKFLAAPSFMVFLTALLAALFIVIYGVGSAVRQRRSRGQLPPGGHLGGLRGDIGNGPVPPGSHTDQNRADLRAHRSRQDRPRVPLSRSRLRPLY